MINPSVRASALTHPRLPFAFQFWILLVFGVLSLLCFLFYHLSIRHESSNIIGITKDRHDRRESRCTVTVGTPDRIAEGVRFESHEGVFSSTPFP